MGRGRRVAVAVATVALVVGFVGCGDDDEPVAERRVPSIGFLSASASSASLDALREGLAALGYREGDTMRLDVRVTEDEAELPGIAEEFVAAGVDLIIAGGTKAIEAARDATASIPIVMTNSGDPVQAGLVDSMATPGGNITGLTQSSPELAPKRLELLQEAFPGLKTVAVVFNPDHPTTQLAVEELQAAAPALGVALDLTPVQDEAALDAAVADAKAAGAGALVVLRDPFTIDVAGQIAAAAEAGGLPAIYETRNFIDDGGLMLYGPDLADLFRRSAGYVDKILRGADPGSLPIGQPTQFELVVSSSAEARLGVEIAESVRLRAEFVD
jgi:putative ABC transport system substrate-binding protein